MVRAVVSCFKNLPLDLKSCRLVNYGSPFDKCEDCVNSLTDAQRKSVKEQPPLAFSENNLMIFHIAEVHYHVSID